MQTSVEEQRIVKVDKRKSNRRGLNSNHKVHNKLRIVGVNSNGISSKLKSLDHIISELSPSIICLQETKMRKVGRIKGKNTQNYTTFELVRQHSGGGVLVHIENMKIRILNAYGPQLNDSTERNLSVAHFHFWSRIEIVL